MKDSKPVCAGRFTHTAALRRRVGVAALPAMVVSSAVLVASCAGLVIPVGCLAARGSVAGPSAGGSTPAGSPSGPAEGSQLESAAHRAGETGRKVAMSLIALGFAIAAVVLAFRRDFKEAVGVFAIGVVAVLFAQEAGVKLVENLVHTLVG
jgi:hypothetical protein